MNGLVRVSEAAILALHTMALMARNGEKRCTNMALAGRLNASGHHLAKVMQHLVNAGLVSSHRGPFGGFSLRLPAEEVQLLQVYEAIEGPLSSEGCLLHKTACPGNACRLGSLLAAIHGQIRDSLAHTTLADFSHEIMSIDAPGEGSVR